MDENVGVGDDDAEDDVDVGSAGALALCSRSRLIACSSLNKLHRRQSQNMAKAVDKIPILA